MTPSTDTDRTAIELENFLESSDYFTNEDQATVNQRILATWGPKFESAIAGDILSKFDHLGVDVSATQFELSSEDNQGACLFFFRVAISDKENSEVLKAFVKILVSYTKSIIYLESSYANVDKWQGKSKRLKLIFQKLKIADKKAGYFNPLSISEFLT